MAILKLVCRHAVDEVEIEVEVDEVDDELFP
jgi:hypothetical protein